MIDDIDIMNVRKVKNIAIALLATLFFNTQIQPAKKYSKRSKKETKAILTKKLLERKETKRKKALELKKQEKYLSGNALSRETIPDKNTMENFKKEATKKYIDHIYNDKSGFNIKSEERSMLGGSATYGEILYESAQFLIKNTPFSKRDVFYDLGSGVGKFVVQAYLNSPVKKCVGVELSPTRYNHSKNVKKRLNDEGKIDKKREISFLESDFLKTDMRDATVVYMGSTCYQTQLMDGITKKLSTECRKGLRVFTLKQLSQNAAFKNTKTYTLPMTWSQGSSVYEYVKIR
jgi:hypothetical protein